MSKLLQDSAFFCLTKDKACALQSTADLNCICDYYFESYQY